MTWYRNVVTYDLARQLETVSSVSAFFTAAGRVITRAVEGLRGMVLRVARDWRLVAAIAATVALAFVLLMRRRERDTDRLAVAVEQLLDTHRLPGETLLECASRAQAPVPVRDLIWRLYRLRFDEGAPDTERDLARAIHSLQREHASQGGRSERI